MDRDAPQCGQILDGYRLIRFLGRGGFGEVWLCRSEAMGGYHAIKFIAGASPELLEKEYHALALYRNAAAKLRSPHLVPIEHINRNGTGLYYVMPLADGVSDADPSDPSWQPLSLSALIQTRATLAKWFSVAEIHAILQPVLSALQTLSDAGLVHRDVKPENILFFNGSPCLGDISLLGEDASVVTRRGTPGYATPSWYLGGHPDMFGAAATLYTLLTGNLPDKMGRAAFLWPPLGESSLSESERTEWKRLHSVIRRATEEKVSERFVDFRTMAEAVAGAVEKQIQPVRPPQPPLPPAGRRGIMLWVAAVVGILLVFVVFGMMSGPPRSDSPTINSDAPARTDVPAAPANPNPSSRRAPKIVDAKGNFTSVRERVIAAIPAAVSLGSPTDGPRLDIKDYAETTAIRKAYQNREYAQCLDLLDSRIKSHPSLLRNPLCMLLKAQLLKQLDRPHEIEKVLQGVSTMPFGNPSSRYAFTSGVSMRLALLEALGRHSEAESLITAAIESAIAASSGSSEDSMAVVALYNQRARVKILRGDHSGALADERAALALSPGKYATGSHYSDAEVRQLHLNTIVMQWELLEQEFPAYAAYLEANGWPEPKPDHRNLKAED
jgi:serine/threonine protein kinase